MRDGFFLDLYGAPTDRVIVATAMGGHQMLVTDWRIPDLPDRLPQLKAPTERRQRQLTDSARPVTES